MIWQFILSPTYIFPCNHTCFPHTSCCYESSLWVDPMCTAQMGDSNWRLYNIREHQMASHCVFSFFMKVSITRCVFFSSLLVLWELIIDRLFVLMDSQWFWVCSEWERAFILYVNIIADPEQTEKDGSNKANTSFLSISMCTI